MTREIDYGGRYKLFRLKAPEDTAAASPAEIFGLALERGENGRHAVAVLAVNGMAERAGIDWGDYVTGVDVGQRDLPPKDLVYPLGAALLALAGPSQYRRQHRRRPRRR